MLRREDRFLRLLEVMLAIGVMAGLSFAQARAAAPDTLRSPRLRELSRAVAGGNHQALATFWRDIQHDGAASRHLPLSIAG